MDTPRRDNKKQLKVKSAAGGMPTATDVKSIEVRNIPGIGVRLVVSYNNKLYYGVLSTDENIHIEGDFHCHDLYTDIASIFLGGVPLTRSGMELRLGGLPVTNSGSSTEGEIDGGYPNSNYGVSIVLDGGGISGN